MYASATAFLNKVYLGTAQGDFKNVFATLVSLQETSQCVNYTTLAKYVSDLKLKHNVTPRLKW